ncbi:hypothetical protein BDY19DRAFT_391256 [Irpex rosettiformis]|uniref:Uncharacterized protein n=1 Tax=Irpex rosettiformis TaxID=378272 RepID=A0ACB8TUM1_9APHY|nr:hypothetical protein BDY19DRAFT_391256 [Irpex rosettiformis]
MSQLNTIKPKDDNPALAPNNASSSKLTDLDAVALQDQPLPEYTKDWGPHLFRPTKLPDNYDTRIDPAHIFVFTVHPITGIQRDFYVTPKPCDYCAKVRQLCSRTRPHCLRCRARENAGQCVFEDGWVRLPGPKCAKPKRKREEDEKDNAKKAKKARTPAGKSQDTAEQNSIDKLANAKDHQATDPVSALAVNSGTSELRIALQVSPTQHVVEKELVGHVNDVVASSLANTNQVEISPIRESGRYSLRRNPRRSAKVT